MRLHQAKQFQHHKVATNKVKRKSAEWEKIFANSATDRRLTFKIQKWAQESQQQQTKQTNQLGKHISQKMKFKQPTKLKNKDSRNCARSLAISEMQIEKSMV